MYIAVLSGIIIIIPGSPVPFLYLENILLSDSVLCVNFDPNEMVTVYFSVYTKERKKHIIQGFLIHTVVNIWLEQCLVYSHLCFFISVFNVLHNVEIPAAVDPVAKFYNDRTNINDLNDLNAFLYI